MRNRKGFTLIELLIVIVIIGILAGVVLAVMNPAEQRRKAAVSVMRANLDKMCLAMSACASTVTSAASCDTAAEIGITVDGSGNPTMNGVPVGAAYTIGASGQELTATATGTNLGTGGTVDCIYTCTHDVDTGESTPITADNPANCFNL